MAGDIKLPDITSRVRLDTDDVDKAVGRTGSSLKKMAGAFAGVAVAVGAGKFLGGAIEEAEEARLSIAQTNAVIASTAGVANVTAKDVDSLSGSLSALTGIDDEVIAGGQNILLTFTKVRNEVGKGNDIFDQGTKAALDMSVALGQDLQSSSILVGKALNDPVKGMTALTRSGIQFTEQQKDQVKAMVAAGDTLGAQKVILKELETQFGGSAEAAASPMARLKVAFGNLQETIGTALMPALFAAATFLSDKLPGAIEAAKRAFASVVAALQPVIAFVKAAFAPGQVDVTWLDTLVGGIRALVGAFQNAGDGITSSGFAGAMEQVGIVARGVFEFIRDNATPILVALGVTLGLIVSPIGVLVAALVYAYTQFDGFRNVVNAVVGFLTDTVIPGIVSFASFIADQFGKLSAWTRAHWGAIQEAIGHVIAVVSGIIETFVSVIQALWQAWGDELVNIVGIVWDQIRNTVETVFGIIQGIIEAGLAIINGDWGQAWDAIKNILSEAWEFIRETIVNALRLAREAVEAGVSAIVALVGGVPGRILSALGNLGSLLYNAGRSIMEGLGRGIKDAVQGVYDFVSGIAGKIASLKGPLDKDRKLLIPAGMAIMDSLVTGLRREEGELVRQLAHVTGLIQGVDTAVPGAVGFARGTTAGSAARTASSTAPVAAASTAPPVVHTTIVVDRKVLATATSQGQYENRRR